jgi:hypothetical protein
VSIPSRTISPPAHGHQGLVKDPPTRVKILSPSTSRLFPLKLLQATLDSQPPVSRHFLKHSFYQILRLHHKLSSRQAPFLTPNLSLPSCHPSISGSQRHLRLRVLHNTLRWKDLVAHPARWYPHLRHLAPYHLPLSLRLLSPQLPGLVRAK